MGGALGIMLDGVEHRGYWVRAKDLVVMELEGLRVELVC